MKKNYLLSALLVFSAFCSFAQIPQKLSYQAVIRNAGNALVTNTSIGIRVSILQDSTSGTAVFQETYSPNPKTDANGLVSIEIGGGIPITGSFAAINWANGRFFVKTEIDPTGGTAYTITGISQLLSVPYALAAGSAPSLEYPDGLNNITPIILDGTVGSKFTVPAGKNFYLNNIDPQSSISIDSSIINAGSTPNIILRSNQLITIIKSPYKVNLGFLVNKTVQVVFQNLNSGNFIVPAGSSLVLFNSYVGEIYLNGTRVTPNNPIIIPSGTIISGNGILNGYLR